MRRSLGAAGVLAVLAMGGTAGEARAEVVCVRVTVMGPVIGTKSTNYTCTNLPVSTWYREVVAPLGPFEVTVEVVTPAEDR